jgi:hypothetical protein
MEAQGGDPQPQRGVTSDDLGLYRVLTFDALRAFNQAFNNQAFNPFFDEDALSPIGVRKVRPSSFFC